jgi:hypothetical protein
MQIGLCLPHLGRSVEPGRPTIDVLAREVRPALGA